MKSVYSAVQTWPLNKAACALSLKGLYKLLWRQGKLTVCLIAYGLHRLSFISNDLDPMKQGMPTEFLLLQLMHNTYTIKH